MLNYFGEGNIEMEHKLGGKSNLNHIANISGALLIMDNLLTSDSYLNYINPDYIYLEHGSIPIFHRCSLITHYIDAFSTWMSRTVIFIAHEHEFSYVGSKWIYLHNPGFVCSACGHTKGENPQFRIQSKA